LRRAHPLCWCLDMKSVVNAFKALSALPVSSVIIDASGMIVAVNDTWKEFGRRNGLSIPNAGVGANYLQYCAESEFTIELKSLLAGRLDLLTLVYPCHSPGEKRWFSLIGVPLSPAKPAGVALLHVNLTGMLPPQVGASLMQVEATSGGQTRPTINVDAISGAIERSVSEALSSQLSTMFTGQDSVREKTLARREADQILVRTRLSGRQVQVLRLLGEGKTNKEIAEALFRSPNTIKLHVSAILQRLKLKSRTQAALLASRLYKGGSTDLSGGDVKSWKNTHTAAAQQRASRSIR
jgi:DNA-binding CsgD family transcriptional regulator